MNILSREKIAVAVKFPYSPPRNLPHVNYMHKRSGVLDIECHEVEQFIYVVNVYLYEQVNGDDTGTA